MHSPHDAGQTLWITEEEERGARVVLVSGEADLENVAPLSALLGEAEAVPTALVLDLSGLRFADSTVVNVLLRAHAGLGDRLRLAAPSDFVRRLFSLTGLEGVLPLHDSVAEAVAAAGSTGRPVWGTAG